jgi:HSP20 family protein
MVRTLVPRVFSDVEDWIGTELAGLGTQPIRVEDFREKDKYVLRAELPGVDPEREVKVNVDRGVLTVEAQRSEEKHERHRSEFRYGALRRSVTLPATADEERISARYDKGILEISVPLREPEREGRAIPVSKAG